MADIDPKLSQNGNGTQVVDPPAPPALTAEEVGKIIDQKLEALTTLIRQGQPAPTPSIPAVNELDSIADELGKEFNLKPEEAKSLVNKFSKIASHANKGTMDELSQLKLKDKFTQVFAANEDADKVAPVMTEVFKALSPLEQNFVLNSPDGAQFIYDKAKRKMGLYSQPSDVRAAASNAPGRTASQGSKLGGKEELLRKAADCNVRGDKKGYEDIMAQISRG